MIPWFVLHAMNFEQAWTTLANAHLGLNLPHSRCSHFALCLQILTAAVLPQGSAEKVDEFTATARAWKREQACENILGSKDMSNPTACKCRPQSFSWVLGPVTHG